MRMYIFGLAFVLYVLRLSGSSGIHKLALEIFKVNYYKAQNYVRIV